MLAQQTASYFALVDWLIVVCYLVVVVSIGFLVSRKHKGQDDYFLAGRSMPMWAVAISLLATSLSAATFIGGPQLAYVGNLTYITASAGGVIAMLIVAFFFLPAFYKHGVTSVYELIGHRYGNQSKQAASAMFMLGRVLASGARLYMVAIPFSLVAFNSLETIPLLSSILIIASGATVYTMAGGIRAVIWTDVLQAAIFITTIGIALYILISKIPVGIDEAFTSLAKISVSDDPNVNKLTVIDTTFDGTTWFTVWTAIIGWTIFNLAAFGTDQDLAQRMLTCKSAKSAGVSAVLSSIIGLPVVILFLLMGSLLFVFYKMPELMGDATPAYVIDDSRKVFLDFIFFEMGPGLRGLMMAGLFAAAMSSLDSALNAMASTTIADFYRPWKSQRTKEPVDTNRERFYSRLAIILWAIPLTGFACLCVKLYNPTDGNTTLITFALGVMAFAYSGLLGVFLTVIFTKRGNAFSSLIALIVGFVSILILRNLDWFGIYLTNDLGAIVLDDNELPIAFAFAMPWEMTIAATLSFIVCCSGSRSPRSSSKN